jgi:hypothetical protein
MKIKPEHIAHMRGAIEALQSQRAITMKTCRAFFGLRAATSAKNPGRMARCERSK